MLTEAGVGYIQVYRSSWVYRLKNSVAVMPVFFLKKRAKLLGEA